MSRRAAAPKAAASSAKNGTSHGVSDAGTATSTSTASALDLAVASVCDVSGSTIDRFLRSPLRLFTVIASVRMVAALSIPITDCDETFNYWEPTHFLLYGKGLQTWEYSPAYGLRSYLYVLLHAAVGKAAQLLWVEHLWGRIGVFYAVRCCLGLTCAAAETALVRSTRRAFGAAMSVAFVVALAVSPGMFHAGVSFLPQSFTMCSLMAAFSAWMDRRYAAAVFWMGVSSLIGWPFSVLLGLVMGVDLVLRAGVLQCIRWFVVCAGACLLPMLCVDRVMYGRWVFASLNIAVYNAPTTDHAEGSNLYGVEPWHFFPLNLFLNFNAVWLLAAAAAPLALVAVPIMRCMRCGQRKQSSGSERDGAVWERLYALNGRFAAIAVVCWGWIVVMSVQPHKEERFLFVVYPLICFAAAYAITASVGLIALACGRAATSDAGTTDRGNGVGSGSGGLVVNALRIALVACAVAFVALSASRTIGYIHHYHAPLRVYEALNRYQSRQTVSASASASPSASAMVCVGKEWYRFPSHFFLHPNTRLGFLKSEFAGQLPQYYAAADGSTDSTATATATATTNASAGSSAGSHWQWVVSAASRTPAHMNAANREEPTRYVRSLAECDFVVDLELPHQTPREPHYHALGHADPNADANADSNSESRWPSRVVDEAGSSVPFLDAAASRNTLTRAFYVPFGFGDSRNVFAPYHALEQWPPQRRPQPSSHAHE